MGDEWDGPSDEEIEKEIEEDEKFRYRLEMALSGVYGEPVELRGFDLTRKPHTISFVFKDEERGKRSHKR